MLLLNTGNDIIQLKDIKPENLPCVLGWYNRVNDFMFATGIDSPLSLEMLSKKYHETTAGKSVFFSGIYNIKEDKMIGIMKGSMQYRNRDAVWINSIVIDSLYQNKGYGTMSVNLLLDYLKKNYPVRDAYLAVVEENSHGMSFWVKQDFKELKRIENRISLSNKQQNIIIMHKKL